MTLTSTAVAKLTLLESQLGTAVGKLPLPESQLRSDRKSWVNCLLPVVQISEEFGEVSLTLCVSLVPHG